MSNYNYYNNGMVDKTIWTNLLRIGTKIHRSEQNRIFLLKCQNEKVLPGFTFLPKPVIIAAKLTPARIRELRWEKVGTSIRDSESRKLYKPNMPVRPICSTVNSLCSGAEKFILRILKPLEKTFEYTINSTKQFRTHFLETRQNFDPSEMEIICIDCVSLYTSVNVELVIEEITKEIFKTPENFFNYVSEELTNSGKTIKIPTESIFKNFLFQILLKYNKFSTVVGHFQQKNGLSMGSSVSPILANFYVNLMEKNIIKNEIQNGTITSYCRYVDDIYCVIQKDSKQRVLDTMNKFDPNFLKFTCENMTNNHLPYLDTQIYLDTKDVPQIKKYRKKTASDVIINFRTSICARKYKVSTLQGDIYRCHYTCTKTEDRDIALKELTELYVRNEYPRKLIENKIQEIRNRNFERGRGLNIKNYVKSHLNYFTP